MRNSKSTAKSSPKSDRDGSIPDSLQRDVSATHNLHNICVYCGSGKGKNPAYANAARQLGKSLAKSDIGLVYGGGSLGLMGEVARATLKHGGRVTGIIPSFLSNRERMLKDVTELVVTDDMHQRKMEMFKR